MSKNELKQIEKNLELSAQFQKYVIQNPSVLDKLPRGSEILIGNAHKPSGHKKFYRAVKKDGGWTLSPVGA